jgi:hypothetical protein
MVEKVIGIHEWHVHDACAASSTRAAPLPLIDIRISRGLGSRNIVLVSDILILLE